MNQAPTTSRFVFHRSQAVASRIGAFATAPNVKSAMFSSAQTRRHEGAASFPARRPLARESGPVDALELALGHADRALGVLAAGADIGEHVEHHEVGDRRRGLLAD